VERFFRGLTGKCVRHGVFHNVRELEQSIQGYIDEHYRKPKPYLWTAKANDILEKVKRAWHALKARGYDKGTRALGQYRAPPGHRRRAPNGLPHLIDPRFLPLA
jgi:hypothetical protein